MVFILRTVMLRPIRGVICGRFRRLVVFAPILNQSCHLLCSKMATSRHFPNKYAQPKSNSRRPSRPWQKLDLDKLRLCLADSALCQPNAWASLNVDELTALWESNLSAILDSLVPLRTVTLRRRPSDPWFDEECRDAKRTVRRLERRVRNLQRHVDSPYDSISAALELWRAASFCYRAVLKSKRTAFWRNKLTADFHSPRKAWHSLNTLMGRGRSQLSCLLSASDFHNFFVDNWLP